MWTRSELKSRAKATLGTSYWMGFAINLICGFAESVNFFIGIFVGFPLLVGAKRFYVRAAHGETNFDNLGKGFDNYGSVLGAMAWRMLFQFLWTLLFFIPGIVKYYSYGMVPYILTDNPTIGYERALKLSMQMAKGHKFDMFMLDLSFLGWFLLGLLGCGIGVLFVYPYYYQTRAELYIALRKAALDSGICKYDELFINQ